MIFNKTIQIGPKVISEESNTFIIAEAGVNHNGDMVKAKQLVDIAAKAGADAIKFQAFKTESLILKNIEKAEYQKKSSGSGESQYDMLKKLEITKQQNRELQEYCRNKDIIFLTTPFDEDSLDELDDLDLPAYKVSSTDITNVSFLRKVAAKGKPILLSTGMAYLTEIVYALQNIFSLNKDVILFQCTANYPIRDDEVNLRVIREFQKNFDMLLGYSDHSVGPGAASYAVALGVKAVEKHITLDKSLPGPDHKASLDPAELAELVRQIRKVEEYLGQDLKIPTLSEVNTRKSLQKCIIAAKKIAKGQVFDDNNIISKRTGGVGISSLYYYSVIGRIAPRDFDKDDIIEL